MKTELYGSLVQVERRRRKKDPGVMVVDTAAVSAAGWNSPSIIEDSKYSWKKFCSQTIKFRREIQVGNDKNGLYESTRGKLREI